MGWGEARPHHRETCLCKYNPHVLPRDRHTMCSCHMCPASSAFLLQLCSCHVKFGAQEMATEKTSSRLFAVRRLAIGRPKVLELASFSVNLCCCGQARVTVNNLNEKTV